MDHKLNEENAEKTGDPKIGLFVQNQMDRCFSFTQYLGKYQDLKPFKGFRKLDNYIKQFIIYDDEIRNDPLNY